MVITGLTRNQLGSDPPRVRISCVLFCFWQCEIRTGQSRSGSDRNSPVDCFGARVRVGASFSLRRANLAVLFIYYILIPVICLNQLNFKILTVFVLNRVKHQTREKAYYSHNRCDTADDNRRDFFNRSRLPEVDQHGYEERQNDP